MPGSLSNSQLMRFAAFGFVLAAFWPLASADGPDSSPVATQPAETATSSPACATPSEALFVEGRRLLSEGDSRGAIRALSQAVANQPARLDFALALAEAYIAAGDDADAGRLLENLAARAPDAPKVHIMTARLHAKRGEWRRVRELLSSLEADLDADGLMRLVRSLRETRRSRDAIEVLLRRLKLTPKEPEMWFTLIDVTIERRQFGIALQRIGQARRHLPNHPQLDVRAARAYAGSGRIIGNARVLTVEGGKPGRFHKDWLLVRPGAGANEWVCCPAESALYRAQRALAAGVGEASALCLCARIWLEAEAPEVGLAILQQREATLLETPTRELLKTLADLALACGDVTAFLRYARLHADLLPEQKAAILCDAYLAAADWANAGGNEELHRELLTRAVRLRPEDADLEVRLADALWLADERDEARTWYRRALERAPSHQQRSHALRRLAE